MSLASLICSVSLLGILAGCDKATEPALPQMSARSPEIALPTAASVVQPTTRFDPTRVVLVGITITATQKQALLSLDKTAPTSFSLGTQVLDGVTLVAIDSDSVVIEADGTRQSLTFPKSAQSSRSAAIPPALEAGPLAKALAPAVTVSSESMPIPAGAGTGNAAFLNALEQAGARARAK